MNFASQSESLIMQHAEDNILSKDGLINEGEIGSVVQTIGFGPHRLNKETRPDWFFQQDHYGGILCDIASHQIDQFLYFTKSTDVEITSSSIGNFA